MSTVEHEVPVRTWRERLAVDLPEGELDGVRVSRFTVEPGNVHNMLLRAGGRHTRPGTYTALTADGKLWMSDTDAEKADHIPAVGAIESTEARRVLIHGLGLGMVLNAALSFEHVEQVDVVELDQRIIDLVGSHYADDERVRIHHGDAYTYRFPKGSFWQVAWHDVWPTITSDNLAGMAKLMRRYGGRMLWQGCWAQDQCRRQQRHWREQRRREREFFE